MSTVETCSCGASLELSGSEPPYRWADQSYRFLTIVADWRLNHRHEPDSQHGANGESAVEDEGQADGRRRTRNG